MRHEFRIGDIVATARTKKGARDEAFAMAEEALTGSYAPILLEYRGHQKLIVRTPQGWEEWRFGLCYPRHQRDAGLPRTEVERSTRLELAQLAWDGIEETSEILRNPEERQEFARWVQWQRRYRVFRGRLLALGNGERRAGLVAQELASGLAWAGDHGLEPDRDTQRDLRT